MTLLNLLAKARKIKEDIKKFEVESSHQAFIITADGAAMPVEVILEGMEAELEYIQNQIAVYIPA